MSAPHAGRAHAKLSPSSAHRWIECPGSIRECAGIPNTSSSFADEGTAAHELCERCLRSGDDAESFIGAVIDVNAAGYVVDAEMAEAVQVYLDFVRPLYAGAEVEVEAKLDLRSVPGMEFGTGDFCAYEPLTTPSGFIHGETRAGGVLTIVDFKYGKGVAVEVKDNPQLLTYAVGVAKRYHNRGLKKIRLAVIQPRCPHFDGPVRVEEYDALDLLDFEAMLTAAALATADPNAPLKAGEHCKFCPAAPKCVQFEAAALEVARADFMDGETIVVDPTVLNADEIADRMRRVPLLKGWLKRFEEYAHAEAMAGRLPTGFKLIPKRATRQWRDPAEAEQFLLFEIGLTKEEAYVSKLVSPAMADKLLKKEKGQIEPYVIRHSSGTNLVPCEDQRQPARPEVEITFETD